MRIISGSAKGRSLQSLGGRPGSGPIRPTTDRSREALFNIIGHEKIQDALVLDLFAGTGALGLEALSRGAAHAVFVDKHQQATKLVYQNSEKCGLRDSCHIVKRDLTKGLRFLHGFVEKIIRDQSQTAQCFDLIFLDPPYEKIKAKCFLTKLQRHCLIGPNSLVVFEDRSTAVLPESVDDLLLSDQRKYGDTGFWFYTYHRKIEILG